MFENEVVVPYSAADVPIRRGSAKAGPAAIAAGPALHVLSVSA
jgi:hypothetical protein